ncbi:MAG TPA: pyridoxal-phosphate dependent enzyme [Actinomycetota bacterium]|nr:pyridoxal-phosphate dependent enzyme [Actinomycetota bacterium]
MGKIAALGRIPIGTWPTDVSRLTATSDALGVEIWAKSEETAGAWGGNKVRKLEFILHAAREDGVRTLVSWGAGTSNWAAALAMHGKAAGFRVALGLGGNVPDDYRALYGALGTSVVRTPHLMLAPVALATVRARAGASARFLPVGGSGTVGDLGTAQLGEEIADQVASSEIPAPAAVFVATGSTGTAAGLSVGLSLGGLRVPVIAVKVSDWPYASRGMINRRLKKVLEHARASRIAPIEPVPVVLDTDHLGAGYGKPTPAARSAIELAARDALVLDPTYAAKAFAALMTAARRGRPGPYLFIATSPIRPAPRLDL